LIILTGQNESEVLYFDVISNEETEYHTRSVDILPEWIANHDSITIQLKAKGNLDMWDEEEEGYAVFFVDRVTADQHFLEPGITWIYAYNEYEYLPGPVIVKQSIETITVGNDTLINGLYYFELTITKSEPCSVFGHK
jgi:hypothetical protein